MSILYEDEDMILLTRNDDDEIISFLRQILFRRKKTLPQIHRVVKKNGFIVSEEKLRKLVRRVPGVKIERKNRKIYYYVARSILYNLFYKWWNY